MPETTEVTDPKQVWCKSCHGSGRAGPDNEMEKDCWACDGVGIKNVSKTCAFCNGSGRDPNEESYVECPTCEGRRSVPVAPGPDGKAVPCPVCKGICFKQYCSRCGGCGWLGLIYPRGDFEG